MSVNELVFYGESDDLIIVEGVVSDTFDPPFDGVWKATIETPDGEKVSISARYRDGEWEDLFDEFEVPDNVDWLVKADEGKTPVPDEWDYAFSPVSSSSPSSTGIRFTVPRGTTVTPTY